jgi:hypothetical protein
MAVFVIIPLCWDMFRILYDPVNKMGFCNGPSCVNPSSSDSLYFSFFLPSVFWFG